MLQKLLVTCCLEQSRSKILKQVISNLLEQDISLRDELIIFDNASTDQEIIDLLKNSFDNVYQSSINVGYWTAIDWFLNNFNDKKYTYIIESDMIHYNMFKLNDCIEYLEKHDDVGSIRLHEYSIEKYYLYNKTKPRQDSKKNLWQSHINKITNEKIKFLEQDNEICKTNFLTQLPAINRTKTLINVFNSLKERKMFEEFDFQSLYYNEYKFTGILDGGIFHCNLNPWNSKEITGSWTPENKLNDLGYKTTRKSTIISSNDYNVLKLNI